MCVHVCVCFGFTMQSPEILPLSSSSSSPHAILLLSSSSPLHTIRIHRSADISAPSLLMLVSLCLAQAQECNFLQTASPT